MAHSPMIPRVIHTPTDCEPGCLCPLRCLLLHFLTATMMQGALLVSPLQPEHSAMPMTLCAPRSQEEVSSQIFTAHPLAFSAPGWKTARTVSSTPTFTATIRATNAPSKCL